MATLIMAYGFDIGKEISSQEEDEEEEADGSSQSAYEVNKGIVPLADLFNAGTSERILPDLYPKLGYEHVSRVSDSLTLSQDSFSISKMQLPSQRSSTDSENLKTVI